MSAVLSAGIQLPTETTSVLDAAEIYCRIGLAPIPIHGINSDGTCSCGPSCHTPGKHPTLKDWRATSLDVDDVRDAFRNHKGNIGLHVGHKGSRLVVIDADGPIGVATVGTWNLPPTLAAVSGSGQGAHYWFVLAEHHDPTALRGRLNDEKIDIKHNGQVVVAPSRHKSGGVYRWTSVLPIATLPDDVYDRIKRTPVPASEIRVPVSVPAADAGSTYNRSLGCMRRMPPAIQGSGGSTATFAVALMLAGQMVAGLSRSEAMSILHEYNQSAVPPWTPRDLERKLDEAISKGKNVKPLEDRPLRVINGGRGQAAPSVAPAPAPGNGVEEDWRAVHCTYDRHGNLKPCVRTAMGVMAHHPMMRGKLRWNDFSERIEVANLPWPRKTGANWTDTDCTNFRNWAASDRLCLVDLAKADVNAAAEAVAQNASYHPVREYLDGLQWDGIQRVERFFVDYFGAEDTAYARGVSRMWLVSAVARVTEPGCKADHMVVLEGPQGRGKSSALRALASEPWFFDSDIDFSNKDAYSSTEGAWIVEFPELQGFTADNVRRVKAYVSEQRPRYRLPYGVATVERPRQCVYAGSTNDKRYLKDETGGRRFWPIKCRKIDAEQIAWDRDQIWAEAVSLYTDGCQWWPDDAFTRLAEEEQEERYDQDPWEIRIADWVHGRDVVTIGDILTALGIEIAKWSPRDQQRVGRCLLRLGWDRRQIRVSDHRRWVYVPPTTESIDSKKEVDE